MKAINRTKSFKRKLKKSIERKAQKLSLISLMPLNLNVITCNTKYLFIFSHMRSRSSVLSHVLGSNTNICGYSELHFCYSNNLDLTLMKMELYRDLKCDLQGKYLLDKILHNQCFISDKVLEIAKPKVIFLLREPQSTLRSIVNMGGITGNNQYKDYTRVLNYYCSRLSGLETYARKLAGNYFFVESDELVNDTNAVLDNLSRWLELDDVLNKNYSTFDNTGKPKYGDPSDNIKSKIIQKTQGYPNIKIPPEILQKGQSSYEKCKSKLLECLA